MENINGESLFLNGIKRTSITQIAVGIIVGIIAAVPFALLSNELSLGKKITEQGLFICPAIGILIGILAVYFVVTGIRNRINPKKSYAYRLVNEKPENVVWIYKKAHTLNVRAAYVITVAASTTYSVVIKPKNKGIIDLQVKGEAHSNLLLEYLRSKLPNAAFGYTDENRVKFAK